MVYEIKLLWASVQKSFEVCNNIVCYFLRKAFQDKCHSFVFVENKKNDQV